MSQDYNATLNLPKTAFPMRAGLPKREPEMLEGWYGLDLYGKMVEKNEGKPRFILHDGPPFSNGYIHMGTALNKCLKDFINRYKSMSGYQVIYTPGWDNHGMPIESAIIKQNKLDRKSMSVPDFRDACQEFASNYVDIQREQFKRLGVLGDWDRPYLTMAPVFEADEVRVFGSMFEKGYIYKGKRPVYWCPHDETALAEAEIEYSDTECDSLYVSFRVSDDKGKLSKYGDTGNMYFVIWTTTTWTLPGNLAICLGAGLDYVLARSPEGKIFILAKGRLEGLRDVLGADKYEIIAELKGSEFEFMTARHPLYERDSIILNGEHVTLESGTGCVHTAPGHGHEDFDICRQYDAKGLTDIGVLVPVDDRGHMTDEAGELFSGMYYEKANKAIQAELERLGALVAVEHLKHQYAHCWRCKNPILYRVTDQWFCSVDAFKDAAVAACEDVKWMPDWGHERMVSMIRERADWCISRQRHWGLPIPVFYCGDCGKPVCDHDTIESVAEIFEEVGSNSWFEMEPEELIPEGYACPHCGGTHFAKETATLDGWFDSGSSHIASLERDMPEEWPSSLYLEGADQYRGWFQSSLLVGVAVKGGAPYKSVLTHGWTVDGDGRAMHKSLGNGIYPEDIIPQYGAELVRLWAGSSDYRMDMRCSDAIFKQLSDKYLKIRNTARFILGNLAGFKPDSLTPFDEMLPLDRWALAELNNLVEKCLKAYEEYEFHAVTYAIHNFCVVEMSSFYLDIIKDRLYCEDKDSGERKSAQTAMYLILDAAVRLLAPILAFTSNEIWQAMPHRKGDDRRHVMLNDMPEANPAFALSGEDAAKWDAAISLRDEVNKALEDARAEKLVGKPLDAKITLCAEGEKLAEIRGLEALDLKTLFICSELEIAEGRGSAGGAGVTVTVEPSEEEKCVRCWCHSHDVGGSHEHPELCSRCAGVVSGMEIPEAE